MRERFPKASFLEARLETGRTHQIRVHFKSIGYPVIGDLEYGRNPAGFPAQLKRDLKAVLGRQALHAWKLQLDHPRTGKRMYFESPLPADFLRAFETVKSASW